MSNHSKSFPYYSCLAYNVHPFINVTRKFGFDFLKTCQCTKQKKLSPHGVFIIYTHIIETYLWIVVLFILMTNNDSFICAKGYYIFGDLKIYANFTFLFASLYVALQYSILKRKKITLHYEMNIYDVENKFIYKVEYMLFAFILLIFCLSIIVSNLTFAVYSHMKMEGCSDFESLLCAILCHGYLFLLVCQMVTVCGCFTIGLFIMGKRLIELSKQLRVKRILNTEFLEFLIEKHLEILECFENVNEEWEMLLPIIYGFLVYLTCFVSYGAIFLTADSISHHVIAWFAFLLLCGCLICARALSVLSSLIYDNFIEIRKCFSMPLTIEYKFKIIDFMKRFGGSPIGLSFAGFFYVKRNFFIRVVSGLYSVFSTLLELTGVTGQKKCLTRIPRNLNESFS